MAEMIPDTLPASSTTGEKRVFAALARLPDDCLIYYEPVVRLLYVAMTRAEDMLVVLHSGSSAYVEELYAALGMTLP